ncbi:Transposase IS200 like protein [compost metagenome]
MANKSYSLAHTKWMCKYHIVFTPKYRRKEIYNQVRKDLIEIFKRLCKYKGVEIIEGHMMPDSSDPTENLSLIIYGISKGKKFVNDLREACTTKI